MEQLASRFIFPYPFPFHLLPSCYCTSLAVAFPSSEDMSSIEAEEIIAKVTGKT
jgi:hypothetical protein